MHNTHKIMRPHIETYDLVKLAREAQALPQAETPKPATSENSPQEKVLNPEDKPVLTLTPLEKIAVHTPTQEEYDTLMRVYECGGWKWIDGRLPTKQDKNYLSLSEKDACIPAGIDWHSGKAKLFNWGRIGSYLREGYKILSTREFYQQENVTDADINRVNEWFEKHGGKQ
jgi:hypothetical protein